jgi:hypothetical protein
MVSNRFSMRGRQSKVAPEGRGCFGLATHPSASGLKFSKGSPRPFRSALEILDLGGGFPLLLFSSVVVSFLSGAEPCPLSISPHI